MNRAQYRGYTLLEVILATTVSLLLVAALYKVIRLHLSTANRGREAVEHEHLSRAISEQFRRDLRHLVVPRRSDSVTSTLTADPEKNASTLRFTGLSGQADWIELFADQLPVDADRRISTPVGLLRIRYELRSGGANDSGYVSPDWKLIRSLVPADFAEAADRGDEAARRWTRNDVLADNLWDARFEYWDEATNSWAESWIPKESRTPPPAIRLSFQLHESAADPKLASGGTTRFHRVVVDLSGL